MDGSLPKLEAHDIDGHEKERECNQIDTSIDPVIIIGLRRLDDDPFVWRRKIDANLPFTFHKLFSTGQGDNASDQSSEVSEKNPYVCYFKRHVAHSAFSVPTIHHKDCCRHPSPKEDAPVSGADTVHDESNGFRNATAAHKSSSSAASDAPLEIWGRISSYLPREDILNLRLLNHEVSHKVSSYYAGLFRRAVIPFRPGIYGLLRDYLLTGSHSGVEFDKNASAENERFHEIAKVRSSIGGGLDMFRQFGDHFRELTISFNVNELELFSKIPKQFPSHVAFWGAYKWPPPDFMYTKYKSRAGLEEMADETPCMRKAFSYLSNLEHLAFDLDCGFGWMRGPDVSIRSLIVGEPQHIFHGRRFEPSLAVRDQRQLWDLLSFAYNVNGFAPQLLHATMAGQDLPPYRTKLPEVLSQYGAPYQSQFLPMVALHGCTVNPGLLQRLLPILSMRSSISSSVALRVYRGYDKRECDDLDRPLPVDLLEPLTRSPMFDPFGFRSMSPMHFLSDAIPAMRDLFPMPVSPRVRQDPRMPRESALDTAAFGSLEQDLITHDSFKAKILSRAQKEYLAESYWIADALMCTQVIAVADNPQWACNIKRMTLRVSDKLVTRVCRKDFWNALSGLSVLELRIIPSWRELNVSNSEVSETVVTPSTATKTYSTLLGSFLAKNHRIKTLTLGWETGGEQADGQFARNQHILPAPISSATAANWFSLDVAESANRYPPEMVAFPHVENLTFHNCWFTPDVLQSFIQKHSRLSLKSLSLDSLSLTCSPRFPRDLVNDPFYAFPRSQLQLSRVSGYRQGSWPDLLIALREYFQSSPPANGLCINFLSCGNVKLSADVFDQTATTGFQSQTSRPTNLAEAFFQRRSERLKDQMMTQTDDFMGKITLNWLPNEIRGLVSEFHLHEGWPDPEILGGEHDEDDDGWGRYGTRNAEAPLYDGWSRGGTGRFSGRLKWDQLGSLNLNATPPSNTQ